MKKKFAIVITAVLLVAAVSAPAVFAAEDNNSKVTERFESMFDSMRNWAKDAQERGQITQEEAERWNKHFDDMEEFHQENGFSGHCGVS
jgi:hypothetical protein